ncbi:MAG: hypothetical protein HXS50_03710 [Theionarchaea archaeon]|nr:hypothetical protein [Theionarchaea archaeon]
MPVRRQYIGIGIMAMIVSTAIVYLQATAPTGDPPLHVTVLRYPENLFGVREESPSLSLSMVCQQPIKRLDIRFISTVQAAVFPELVGSRMENVHDLLDIPPLSNLSTLFSSYGAEPRITSEDVEIENETLRIETINFDHSAGGILGSGAALLVYDFILNSTDHVVYCCTGMEDFFVIGGETLEYIGIEFNANITEYYSEERTGYLGIEERPEGGLIRLNDLVPGDVFSLTLRWHPNIKNVNEEAENILSGKFFIQRIEVTVDGEVVDLSLDPVVLTNLG